MNILIAGGSGFLGTALSARLTKNNHKIYILTRQRPRSADQIQWDARMLNGWTKRLEEMDAVIHLTGYGLEHWPWTSRHKKRFIDSRVIPGLALASAFEKASRRPGIFVQASGINRYGLRGDASADESTAPGTDFLGQLTIRWENATQSIDELGVRRVILRTAAVLARHGGQLPLMTLPVRLFFGGKFGSGKQSMNWIHVDDYTRAILFLLENETARGPYNLISPARSPGEDFMHAAARALHRPFWFHIPKAVLQLTLGEMSDLLTEGRYAQPIRLLELGFQFQFGKLDDALHDLLA